ncbi:hypothetical protein HOY82DRAFT_668044 [Tuber indicum]|nr:hypothetical protein HOY82DRAFT_668044 [Tuber indicum]
MQMSQMKVQYHTGTKFLAPPLSLPLSLSLSLLRTVQYSVRRHNTYTALTPTPTSQPPMSATNTPHGAPSYEGSPPSYESSFTSPSPSSPSSSTQPVVTRPPRSSEEPPPAYGRRGNTKPIPYRAYNLLAHVEGRSINSTPPSRVTEIENPELANQIRERRIPKVYLKGAVSEEKAEKLRRKNEEIRAARERDSRSGGLWGKIKNAIRSEQEVNIIYLTAEEVAMRNMRRDRQRSL